MDAILKSFSIGFLLRSFFAGTFFVLTYYLSVNNCNNITKINSENILSISLLFALISGATVYGLHRSLFYPFIEWFFNSTKAKAYRRAGNTLISKNTVKNLINTWDKKSKSKDCVEKEYGRATQVQIWADYIHLQFTSAWCIGFGFWAAIVSDHDWSFHGWLFSIALILLMAALISNWRAHSVEEYGKRNCKC